MVQEVNRPDRQRHPRDDRPIGGDLPVPVSLTSRPHGVVAAFADASSTGCHPTRFPIVHEIAGNGTLVTDLAGFIGSTLVDQRGELERRHDRILPLAPSELAGLSPQLVRHTCQVHELEEEFRGRRVVVIGAGQSALETAALVHEAGVDVQVIQRPVAQLSEGWRCAFWNTPSAFRRLPESYTIPKAQTLLGLLRRLPGVRSIGL